jgi:CRP/FNR family cyclic AMP-dependent transcriptional regulator
MNEDKINLIKKSPIFNNLPEEALQSIAYEAEISLFKKREIIYLPASENNTLYLLASGKAKISRLSEDGREIIIEIINSGEIFGEAAIFSNNCRENMATALEKSLVLRFEAKSFKRFLDKFPQLSAHLLNFIAEKKRNLENKIEDLAFRNVPSRLARVLLQMADIDGQKLNGQIRIQTRLSQQEIGNLIGSTRETTSHFLNRLKKIGFINFGKREINILDREKLKELGERLISLN